MRKSILLIAFTIFAAVGAVSNVKDDGYFYFPDEENPGSVIKANLFPLRTYNETPPPDPSSIRFLLYTPQSSDTPDEVFIGDVDSIQNSSYRLDENIKVLVHGFTGNIERPFPSKLRLAFTKLEEWQNIFVVDWKELAAGPDYFAAVNNAKICSKFVTSFIEFLIDEGFAQTKNIHLIGHSLGAQVVGQIGYQLREKVPRITASDPSRPLYDIADPEEKVDPSDADFVDVIHVAGLTLSFVEPQGDVDFYPNGGLVQPGCGLDPAGTCSHGRSPMYIEESLFNPTGFKGVLCDGWQDYLNSTCDGNPVAYMGYHTDHSARGSFFLTTNDSPPFAQS